MKNNIILLHGWGASAVKLQPLGDELKKLGWNVFIPKLPGFDLKPPNNPFKLDDYCEFVNKKASQYFKNQKYVAFGHSFGGRIAIKISSDYKDNIYASVFCAAGGLSRTGIIKRLLFSFLAKMGKILLISKFLSNTFRKIIYKLSGEHDYEKTSGVMRETFKNIINEDLKKKLSGITLPVLVLWGKKDKMVPFSDALLLKNKIKKCKLVAFDFEGHTLPYKKPHQLAQEINKWHQTLT